MRGKSGEIQQAILELLEKHHKLRTEQIVPKVCEKVGCSPTPVYHNLRRLVKIDKIGLDEFKNGGKEYYDLEIIKMSKNVIKSQRTSLDSIAIVDSEIKKVFKNLDQTRQGHIVDLLLRMQQIQYATYKSMEIYSVFRKNKKFVKMKQEYDQAFTNTIRLLDEIPNKKQVDEVFLQMNNERIFQQTQLQKELEEFADNLPDDEKRILGYQ